MIKQDLRAGRLVHSEKLSPEEKQLAEKYHRLIYTFLNEEHLNEREYYGLAAIGYCKAVKQYCAREQLRQWSFTTVAWKKMCCEVYNERQKRRRLKRAAEVLSLDAPAGGEEPQTLYNYIGDLDSGIEELPVIELQREIKERLGAGQRQQLENILKGYTIRESAEIMHISASAAYKNQREIKRVALEVINDGRGSG